MKKENPLERDMKMIKKNVASLKKDPSKNNLTRIIKEINSSGTEGLLVGLATLKYYANADEGFQGKRNRAKNFCGSSDEFKKLCANLTELREGIVFLACKNSACKHNTDNSCNICAAKIVINGVGQCWNMEDGSFRPFKTERERGGDNE
jgi:hypothetical protein